MLLFSQNAPHCEGSLVRTCMLKGLGGRRKQAADWMALSGTSRRKVVLLRKFGLSANHIGQRVQIE